MDPKELQAIIDSYVKPDKKVSLSHSLETVKDLDALLAAAKQRGDELLAKKPEDLTDEELSEVDTLVEIRATAAASKADAAALEAAKVEKVTAAKEKLAALKTVEPEAPKPPEPVVEPAATQPLEPDPSPDIPVEAPKELVGAAFSVASLPSTPPPVQHNLGALSNTFAVANGAPTDRRYEGMSDVADAFVAQAARQRAPGRDTQTTLATFKRPVTDEFTVDLDDAQKNARVIDSLIADKAPTWDTAKGQFAAGWCAPSETLYELCPMVTSLDGIVNLPEVVATRGGVRTTAGPNFATLFANASIGQVLTEAQVIAATAKTCIEIDCPSFVDTRLDVNPLCVTGNLLTTAGYPEYVERFIRESVAANAHKINLNVLNRMVAASTAVNVASTPPATGPVDTSSVSMFLDYASLYATWLRDRYRLAFDSLIEVVAPVWYYQQMTSDVSRRNGVDMLAADARIRAAFAERNIRIQWVYDWQPMAATALLAATRPLSAQVLIYIPGTFVKLTAPVINLGTIHSAAQLATNQYTALFVEEGFNVLERCFEGLAITIPTCPSGTTGAATGSCDSTP